jgi:hypothetical protein
MVRERPTQPAAWNPVRGGMTTCTARTLRAFFLAPLVPPLLYWALAFPILAALPGFMAYGGACGYLAILLVGVPAYNLITTHARLRAYHVFAISGILGAGTFSLMSGAVDIASLWVGVPLGLSAGIAFWLLWRKNAVVGRTDAHRPVERRS